MDGEEIDIRLAAPVAHGVPMLADLLELKPDGGRTTTVVLGRVGGQF